MEKAWHLPVERGFGQSVTGPLLVSSDGFSPRYDLDRNTGVITRKGHSLEGCKLAGHIVVFPSAKGGVAAGWAFLDLQSRGLAPLAFVFLTVNSVMVHGAVMANIPIADGISPDDAAKLRTGWVAFLNPTGKELVVRR